MSAIGRGDWVQCIDASPGEKTGHQCPLRLGDVYCVEAIVTSRSAITGELFPGQLLLHGELARGPGGRRLAYDPNRFKPLGGNSMTAPPQEVFNEWERRLQDT